MLDYAEMMDRSYPDGVWLHYLTRMYIYNLKHGDLLLILTYAANA